MKTPKSITQKEAEDTFHLIKENLANLHKINRDYEFSFSSKG